MRPVERLAAQVAPINLQQIEAKQQGVAVMPSRIEPIEVRHAILAQVAPYNIVPMARS